MIDEGVAKRFLAAERHPNDPDDTDGRALYRALADRLASAQVHYHARRKRLRKPEEGVTPADLAAETGYDPGRDM